MLIMMRRPPCAPRPKSWGRWALLLLLVVASEGTPLFNQSAQLLLTAIATSNSTLLAPAAYTFAFSRFSAAPVPLNSLLLLTFSSQYAGQLPPAPACSANGLSGAAPSCSFSGSALYVSQLFASTPALSASSFSLSVSNIINPWPAGDYSPLTALAIIAPNSSVFEAGTTSASVSIVGGSATCSSSVSNAFVFQRGQVSVSYASSYISAGNYDIFVSIPTTYPDDLTGTAIEPALSLPNHTLSLYPGVYLFQAAFASSFTVTMLMPPSTWPEVNFISIYTQTKGEAAGAIDSCSITIGGMEPNSFSSMSVSKGVVQTTAALQFDLTLSTPLFQSDTLTIAFPAAFGLTAVGSSVAIAGFGTLTLTRYDNTLLISSISSQSVLNARLIFTISGVAMPFTAAPYALSLSLGTSANYSRIVQSFPYSAAPGALSVALSCLNTEIGTTNTRCLFSFSTVSQLASSGSLNVMFPNEFPLASGSSPCAISGSGLFSNINCLYTASNNTIQAASLTASSSNIAPLPLSLTVTVNMSQHVGNYSLTVSTQSLGGTVDVGSVTLATTGRLLRSGEFRMISSSQVTNSATTYTVYFSLPFDLGVTYTVVLSLPFAVQTGLGLALTGAAPLSFAPPLLSFPASQLTGNASFSIANLLTPSSLQPATVTVQVIYNSVTYFTGSAVVAMSQLRQFSLAAVAQSSQVVYAAALATISLAGLSAGDKIVLSAYAGFYLNSQPNCSSTVVSCGDSGVLTVLNANASGPTVFTVNMQNLGYVGQSQLNVTSYDSTQSYAKLSSLMTLSVTTPNAIAITANQTNPYLNEQTTYSFTLQFSTPSASILLVTPPSGLFVTAATCLLNCGNATKLTVGYLFPVSSTNCRVTFSLTNPTAFASSVKFVFKTSNAQGDMDYGEYSPEAVCASPCRSCSIAGGSSCLTCYSWSAQAILSNGSCIGACPNGFFQTVASGIDICSQCSALCTACSGSSTSCSSCRSGAYLFGSGCFQSCPVGTYTSPADICIACLQANCSVCSETACSACLAGSSFFNGTCLPTCPPNYYSNSGACIPCAATCLVCSPASGSCSSCLSPSLLYGGSCYSACPSGVFQQLNSNVCEACQSPCASCSLFSTNCTSCLRLYNATAYFLLANLCYPALCPDGYFGNASSALCVQCPSGCTACSSSVCLNCGGSLVLYQGSCYSQCPPGTYQNSSSCLACNFICAACLSPSLCTACISGFNLFNSTCLLACPSYFYANLTGGVCLPCGSPCSLCSYLGCINCLSGYYLQQTSCTASCSGAFHPNNASMVCEGCQTPCLGCTWSASCTSCVSGYSLLASSCLSSCPASYYSDGAQCLSCPGNCTSCTFLNNQPACTACAGGLLLYSFACVSACPAATQQSNGYCLSSDCSALPHCTSCAGNACLQCASLFQMDSSYSCSQYVSGSAVAGALMGIPVPFPFLIAILMVVVVAFLLKHNFPKMFSPLFIYAIAGCFEFLCLALWVLLSVFWNMGVEQPLPYESVVYAPVLIGCAYVVLNVAQFVLWNRRVLADRQYRLWEKQDNRCASLSIAVVALLLSFRLDALKFSRTGHNPRLSARLASPEAFRHYSVLAVLSLLVSAVSILVSVYLSYLQTSLNYLFFTGLEVAVIAIIMIVLSVAVLCVSRAQLLEDKSEYQVGHDHDQLDGKSVEELLNGLGVVEEHHEHHHYEDSGNAVLMKNDYSSEHLSQDLTLMEPVLQLAFDEKTDSQAELSSQSRKRTEPQAVGEEEGEGGEGSEGGEEIFGEAVETSSKDHILVDEFERDKQEALQLTDHYGLSEQQLHNAYPRLTGAIVKQRLPELREEPSEVESVGSFEQFSVDITRGRWRKQTPPRLAGEEEQLQGEDIEELQIRELIAAKIRQEEAERREEKIEQERCQAEQRQQEALRRGAEERRAKEQLRLQEELRAKEELKLQQIAREQERARQEAWAQEELEQKKKRKAEEQQSEKRRRAAERLQKLEMQKRREEEWRLKKEQARLKKLEEERQLLEKMERLREEEEELHQRLKEEEAKEVARLEEERQRQVESNRRELEKIEKLKANLQQLEGMEQEFHEKDAQLEQEQRQLQFSEQERKKEHRERGLMAVEDRLSRMAIVFEDMWRKAAQLKQKKPKRINISEENEIKIPKQTISYHNDDGNLVSELSPRKIKVSPRPQPSQYTRKHLFVEEGTEILSGSSSQEVAESEVQIVFEGGEMKEERGVEKPKSILQHRKPDRTKLDYLHYHDQDIKEIEDLRLRNAFASTTARHEALRSAPHKEMPKEDSDEPITMVFENKITQVLEEEEEEERQSSEWSHPSRLEARQSEEGCIDIEYVGRSIHSGSSDTHWPIEPQMQERILEVERRANRYISQPKRKDSLQRYIYETPENRIYEEEGEGGEGEREQGETELGEIVFEESDQILESDSRGTGVSRSVGNSSGRRRYPTGRVNRMVIDLSPDK